MTADKGPKPKPLTIEEIAALVTLAEERAGPEQVQDDGVFDSLVSHFKQSEAAEINRAGFSAQLSYLCRGMTYAEAREFVINNVRKD